MNRLDVPAAVVRPAVQRRRTRRDRLLGDLVPVLAVAATVVVAVGTAPHTSHIADALIHPMARTNHNATDAEPSDRVPLRVEVPDLRGMTFELARETAVRAGLHVVPLVNNVPTSNLFPPHPRRDAPRRCRPSPVSTRVPSPRAE
jgi:hypothetical protein